jgi:hypothetical protein
VFVSELKRGNNDEGISLGWAYKVTEKAEVSMRCGTVNLNPKALMNPISLANAMVAVSAEAEVKTMRNGMDHILA